MALLTRLHTPVLFLQIHIILSKVVISRSTPSTWHVCLHAEKSIKLHTWNPRRSWRLRSPQPVDPPPVLQLPLKSKMNFMSLMMDFLCSLPSPSHWPDRTMASRANCQNFVSDWMKGPLQCTLQSEVGGCSATALSGVELDQERNLGYHCDSNIPSNIKSQTQLVKRIFMKMDTMESIQPFGRGGRRDAGLGGGHRACRPATASPREKKKENAERPKAASENQ